MKAQFTAGPDFETLGSKDHNGFVKYLVLCSSFCYSDENRFKILSLPLRSLGQKSQLRELGFSLITIKFNHVFKVKGSLRTLEDLSQLLERFGIRGSLMDRKI